jgi:hypothetical protein
VAGAVEAAQESGDAARVDDKLQEASAAIARLLKS